jgi:hypothetical protein
MATRFGGAILNRVGQFVCRLSGHAHMVQFEADRMFLECFHCGHRTSGWLVAHRHTAERPGKTSTPELRLAPRMRRVA